MAAFKKALLIICKNLVSEKIRTIQLALKDIVESTNSETKSSLGDKHETARAKMQFEREKVGKQLELIELQMRELNRIDDTKISSIVGFGSVVETQTGLFFISVPLGKIEFDQRTIFGISPSSPLAQELYRRKIGDSFVFNNIQYTILNIY